MMAGALKTSSVPTTTVEFAQREQVIVDKGDEEAGPRRGPGQKGREGGLALHEGRT